MFDLIGGREEQLEHYRKVRERLAANARPQLAPPVPQVQLPPPVARMRVPTLAEVEAQQIAREAIPEHLKNQRRHGMRIVREVAMRHSCGVDAIMSTSRRYLAVLPRREAMWRMRHELGWSTQRIGHFFSKDHTTVTHNITAYEKGLK